MRRSLVILVGILAVGGALFAGSFWVSRQICRAETCNPADDLDWLRREFRLGDADMDRIRKLHAGYLPICGEMCARIAAKKAEVEAALQSATNLDAAAARKISELGELRGECQARMLQHFMEVSRAMPPEQGRRYLAEMERLTVGSDGEMEQSMSGRSGHEHHEH